MDVTNTNGNSAASVEERLLAALRPDISAQNASSETETPASMHEANSTAETAQEPPPAPLDTDAPFEQPMFSAKDHDNIDWARNTYGDSSYLFEAHFHAASPAPQNEQAISAGHVAIEPTGGSNVTDAIPEAAEASAVEPGEYDYDERARRWTRGEPPLWPHE